uniref:Helicase ATP-binding domain-containing protein n=1 Tax=viral metagenome TaxID=1070528 RepID=A0A6C0F7K3_9ZZZZ
MSDHITTKHINAKLLGVFYPTQYGKTNEVIKLILKRMKLDDTNGKSCHIIFTQNNLLCTDQFAKRILKSFKQTYGESCVCVLSSDDKHKNQSYQHVKNGYQLNKLLINKNKQKIRPSIIIHCSHPTRFDDIVEVMDTLQNKKDSKKFDTIFDRAFIYYDEAHLYLDKISELKETCDDYSICKGHTFITATSSKLQNTLYEKITFMPLPERPNYCSIKDDMNFKIIDDFTPKAPKKVVSDFVSHVLTSFPDILKKGARCFMPGKKSTDSHDEIKTEVLKHNPKAVVIVFNGNNRKLYYSEHNSNLLKPVKIEQSTVKETNEVISDIIHDNNLQDRPIIYTGYLCIKEGLTLLNSKLGTFTSAIFGHEYEPKNKTFPDTLYQLAGRLTGNTKNWENFNTTTIYCKSEIKRLMLLQESINKEINDKKRKASELSESETSVKRIKSNIVST